MEIEGFENYLIYEDGSVYSKKNKKFLKSYDTNGYLRVTMPNDIKKNIHRLVAEHYIPNPHNYKEVDHIDRDKTNNSISNLRWVNHSMNQHNTGLRKDNKLGIKNIHPTKDGYRFKIVRNGKRHDKHFTNLEEAIKYKEEYLNRHDN